MPSDIMNNPKVITNYKFLDLNRVKLRRAGPKNYFAFILAFPSPVFS